MIHRASADQMDQTNVCLIFICYASYIVHVIIKFTNQLYNLSIFTLSNEKSIHWVKRQ